MVGLQTLDLAIGVRVPASQPKESNTYGRLKNSVARLCAYRVPTGIASAPRSPPITDENERSPEVRVCKAFVRINFIISDTCIDYHSASSSLVMNFYAAT